MLMPTLSVTIVGLAVGLLGAVLDRRLSTTVLWSCVGAWIGFVGGALVGVMIDVVAGSGAGVVIVGHLAAALGAVTALVWSRRRAGDATARRSAR